MRGWLVAALLAFAVAGGTLLRLTPCLRHPGFEFIADGRYHERLTGEVVAAGALAAVDPLCNAGAGRRTADHLPLGLYFSGAAAHRGLEALGSRDLRWNLAWTSAFAGALIALPAAFGAYALFRDRRVAVIAGLIAVLLPAHWRRVCTAYLMHRLIPLGLK